MPSAIVSRWSRPEKLIADDRSGLKRLFSDGRDSDVRGPIVGTVRHLGCYNEAIRQRHRAAGRTMATRTDRDLDELQRLAAAGLTQREIAHRLGVSRSTVQRDLRRLAAGSSGATVVELGERLNRKLATRAAGGRLTRNNVSSWLTSIRTILPPPNPLANWRDLDLNRDTLDNISPTQLAAILVDLAPEPNRALWDFTRMFDAGCKITVHTIGSDKQTPHEQGQAAIDDFIRLLGSHYGSFKVITARMAASFFIRGAVLAELVLDRAGRMPVDFVTPDPASIRFEEYEDPIRGTTWRLGQWQGGDFVILDRPTIQYVALDPLPGSPYGRPMIQAAIFPALFLLGLFQDLRRVVTQQGYPRLVLKVIVEKVRELNGIEDADELAEAVDDLITKIGTVWDSLEPDDAYIGTDMVEVADPVGTVSGDALAGVDAVIDALERQLITALKSTRLVMGKKEGGGEAEANREWELYLEAVKQVQQLAEELLERQLGLALEAQGIAAEVDVEFEEVRASEALRDEQTLQLRLQNAENAERLGYMSHDEGSEHAVGHPAVADRQEPVAQPMPNDEDDTANPGNLPGQETGDVGQETGDQRTIREPFTPAGGADGLDDLPESVGFTTADERKAARLWDQAAPGLAGLLDAAIVESEADS